MVTPREVSGGQSQVPPPLNQRTISGLATLNLPVAVVESKVLILPDPDLYPTPETPSPLEMQMHNRTFAPSIFIFNYAKSTLANRYVS